MPPARRGRSAPAAARRAASADCPGRQRRLRHGLVDERVDHVGAAASRAAMALSRRRHGCLARRLVGWRIARLGRRSAAGACGLPGGIAELVFGLTRALGTAARRSASRCRCRLVEQERAQEIDQGLLIGQTRLGADRVTRGNGRLDGRSGSRARAASAAAAGCSGRCDDGPPGWCSARSRGRRSGPRRSARCCWTV